jgi:hypothetical protein
LPTSERVTGGRKERGGLLDHSEQQAGQAQIAAEGGADRRSAKNAAAPMDQPREAHRSAWPLHCPKGAMSCMLVGFRRCSR